jgi:hypothetical protein
MRIFKYALEVTDRQEIDLPAGSEPLCVQVQRGVPCLWALVPAAPDNPAEYISTRLVLYTHGTGHVVSTHAGQYLGTYQLRDGAFVGHVFKER